MSFGSLVKQYLQTHELSYQDLTDRLGYRSKTSVARIARDATSYELRLDFFNRFALHFPLTEEERESFQMLLDISRLENGQQKLFLAFQNLFHARQPAEAVQCISFGSGESRISLEQLLRQRCQQSRTMTVYLFGWCSVSVLRQLYRTLNEMNASFSIQHFLFEPYDQHRFVQLLADAASFLFDSRYILRRVPQNADAAAMNNQYLIHCDLPDGSSRDDLLLQIHQTQLLFQPHDDAKLYEALLNLTACLNTEPLKESRAHGDIRDRILSAVEYQKLCISLEEDQAMYSYCEELAMAFIPPAIFRDAIMPSLPLNAEILTLVRELCSLQQTRYQILHSKHSPSYFILAQNALKNFLWTGRLKNHPFPLRTFTPKERVLILSDVLSLAHDNPFVFVRIAADDMPKLWNTITLRASRHMTRASAHGGSSQKDMILLMPSVSSGDLSLLRLPDQHLTAAFATYYMDELWKQHTLSPKRSADIIHTMIQYQAVHLSE